MPRGELPAIPDNAHLLAWDHRRRKIVAYDVKRKFLGNVAAPRSSRRNKRQATATACTPVDQSTLKRVSGYKLLEDYAAANWGADWDRMLTNPPEYPDNSASVCVQDVPPTMSVEGSPSCSTEDSTASETAATANGVLTLPYKRGTSTELNMTVTQASLFPWLDGPMLAKINTPSLASNLESFPAEVSIMNQDTATATVTGNSLRNTTVSATASAGQTCSVALTKTSCTGTASGRVQVSARGWLWVNYGSTRDGHYHWAISIDAVIADVEQRSSYMDFKAVTKSSGFTAAAARCAFAANNSAPTPNPQENNTAPSKGVSPVLIAVPVALSILAVILGIVAYFVWRRRKQDMASTRPSQMSQPSNNSTHPGVRPIWLPPASTAPPSSGAASYAPGRPSVDTSAGMAMSPAQGGRVSEKYRAMATMDAMSPGGPMPPAYSEAAAQSTSSGPGSVIR